MSSLLDAIKNKRQAIAAKSGRERPTKLTSAKNLVRILPRWDGNEEGIFFQDFGQHFIKDKQGNIQAVYICTATTFGTECQICGEIARHSAQNTDEEMIKVLQEAKPSSRMLVNAIYMNGTHANPKTEPVLLELPVSVVNDVLGIMETYLEDHSLNLISMKEGYDVVITKTGSGRDTKYTVTPSPKSREIANVAETLQKCRNLEDYAKQEYEAGLQKAIASLNAVAGNLAGPSTSSAARLAGPSNGSSQGRQLAEQTPVDMDDLEMDALLDQDEKPAPTSKPAPTPAPATSTIDDDLAELDDLLNEAAA